MTSYDTHPHGEEPKPTDDVNDTPDKADTKKPSHHPTLGESMDPEWDPPTKTPRTKPDWPD